jgi:hypothetical protein
VSVVWCADEVKVAVVEAGCVEKLTHISSPSLQMKAIDLLILICANGNLSPDVIAGSLLQKNVL